MNENSLSYHTKLQEWSQIYHLTADGRVYKASRVPYLAPQKFQQIESWRKDVSKNFKRPHSSSHIKRTRPLSNVQNSDNGRSLSGNLRTRSQPVPHKKKASVAWSSKTSYAAQKEISHVTNNLAETSLHYAAQREELHKANTSPVNQSILINKNLHIGDTQAPVILASELDTSHDASKQEGGTVNGNLTPERSTEIVDNVQTSENNNNKEHGTDVENLDVQSAISEASSVSGATAVRMANRGHLIQVNDHSMVSVRSQSNHLLNVISIDDCKLACRFKRATFANVGQVFDETKVKEEDNTVKINDVKHNGKKSPSEKMSHQETFSSRKLTSYGRITNLYPPSDSETKGSPKTRTAKITKAIDGLVHDRKVMDTSDRDFDTRIGQFGRLVLDRPEGGPAFRRLNSALKKHINNIVLSQTHRVTSSHSGSSINSSKSENGASNSVFTNGDQHNDNSYSETPESFEESDQNFATQTDVTEDVNASHGNYIADQYHVT